MSLSREQRAALPPDAFAVPGRRALPIHDQAHVRMAWSQIMRAAGLTEDDRATGRTRIAEQAKALGVDLTATVREMRFEEPLSAMALEMPGGDHPNKLPFTGVLTRLDVPSDKPPGGSKGRKVVLTAAAAEKAIPSLLGMGVNLAEKHDNHDVKRKIGVITAAEVKDAAIHIGGFIYASDFPEESARIQSDQADLGFSWELSENLRRQRGCGPLGHHRLRVHGRRDPSQGQGRLFSNQSVRCGGGDRRHDQGRTRRGHRRGQRAPARPDHAAQGVARERWRRRCRRPPP